MWFFSLTSYFCASDFLASVVIEQKSIWHFEASSSLFLSVLSEASTEMFLS